MQPEARGCEEAGDSRSGPQWQAGSPQAQTDLVLALAEGEELEGSIEFAAELFRPATAERMARHLEVCALHQMICGTCPPWLYRA
jgi:non-ribosomal peptide synthetase component F